jgi:ribosomal protein S18 acetylase RimI-like enzyme
MAERPERDENAENESIIVRNLREDDLEPIVRIDATTMGRRRIEYYKSKIGAALQESRPRVSLVAEADGMVAGFLMATMQYGEFGRPEPTAVIDSIGVNQEMRHRGVGDALMRQFIQHTRALAVERIRSEVSWNNFALLGFLGHWGFAPGGQLVLELEVKFAPMR